jgi:hypothetical protein
MVSTMLRGRPGLFRAVVAGAALLLAGRGARGAEPRDAAAAEALFEDAKVLLERGEVAAACPKFEESFRLDPATGALFAMALCHERAGRLATAWVEYIEAAARSNAEHNAERENSARERAGALLPRLSFLIIRVDPATAALPGLSITHDGVGLRPAAFGSALPVDPGRHVVRAEAPGHQRWEASVDVGDQPQRATLDVPTLAALAQPAPPAPPAPPAAVRHAGTLELTPLRIAGLALGGAGVSGLSFAAFASWRALDKKASSEHACTPVSCSTQAGQDDRIAAREAALWATAGAISGVALLGAGTVAWLLGKPSEDVRAAESTLLVGPGGATFRRTF